MRADFTSEDVTLTLTPHEYVFVYLMLSHTLHGPAWSDHDFRNILGMSREGAESLMADLKAAESRAQDVGTHWRGVIADDLEGGSGDLN